MDRVHNFHFKIVKAIHLVMSHIYWGSPLCQTLCWEPGPDREQQQHHWACTFLGHACEYGFWVRSHKDEDVMKMEGCSGWELVTELPWSWCRISHLWGSNHWAKIGRINQNRWKLERRECWANRTVMLKCLETQECGSFEKVLEKQCNWKVDWNREMGSGWG